MVDYITLAKSKIEILRDAGFELKKGMKILDFGCGAGHLVEAFLELGYDAYGIAIDAVLRATGADGSTPSGEAIRDVLLADDYQFDGASGVVKLIE